MSGRQIFPSGDSGTGSGAPWTDPSQALLGLVLDNAYSVDSLIGSGGMGYVYSGTHLRLKKRIAIKVPKSDYSRDAIFMSRFEREALTLGRIEHENIVKIYDVRRAEESSQSISYLVMEFIEGLSLYEYLSRNMAKITVGDVLAMLGEAADAIDYAHANQIVHRDLKPENIMIRLQDRRPKILDFGIARVGETASTMTMQGHGSFTPAYASPEQCSGVPAVPASDVYSFAATVYYCFAGGQHIFDCREYTQFILAHASQEPISLLKRSSKWPPAAAEALRSALAKNPADRPQRCADLVSLLRKALAGSEPKPYGMFIPERPISRSTTQPLAHVDSQTELATMGRAQTYGRAAGLTVMEAAHGPSTELVEKQGSGKPRKTLVIALVVAALAGGIGAAAIVMLGNSHGKKDTAATAPRTPQEPAAATPLATPAPSPTPGAPDIRFAGGGKRTDVAPTGQTIAFESVNSAIAPRTDDSWISIDAGSIVVAANDGWAPRDGRVLLPNSDAEPLAIAQKAPRRIEIAAIGDSSRALAGSKLVLANQSVGTPQTVTVRANFDPTTTLPEIEGESDWFSVAWKRGGSPDPDRPGANLYALAITPTSRNASADNREASIVLDADGRQRVALQQPGLACQWTLVLPSLEFPSDGGSPVDIVAKQTAEGCGAPPALRPSGETRMIRAAGAWESAGDGTWTLEVVALRNPDTQPKTMRIDLAGQPFLGAPAIEFRLLGKECAPQFAWAAGGTEARLGYEAAALAFGVRTDAECAWRMDADPSSALGVGTTLSGTGPKSDAMIAVSENPAFIERRIAFLNKGTVVLSLVQEARPRPQDAVVSATPTPTPASTPDPNERAKELAGTLRADLAVDLADGALLMWGPEGPSPTLDRLAVEIDSATDPATIYRCAVLVSFGDFLRRRNPVDIDRFLKSHEARMPAHAAEIKELRDWYATMARARFQPQSRTADLGEAGSGLEKGTFSFDKVLDADFGALDCLAVLAEGDWRRDGKRVSNQPTILTVRGSASRISTPVPVDLDPAPDYRKSLKAASILQLAGDAFAVGTNHGLYVAFGGESAALGGGLTRCIGRGTADKPATYVDLVRTGRSQFVSLSFDNDASETLMATRWTWSDTAGLKTLDVDALPRRGEPRIIVGYPRVDRIAYAASHDVLLLFGSRGPEGSLPGSLGGAVPGPAPFALSASGLSLFGADRLGRVYGVGNDPLRLHPFEPSGSESSGTKAFENMKEFIWGQDDSLAPGQRHSLAWRPEHVAVDPMGNVALVKSDGQIEIRWRPVPRALADVLGGA